jgi:hypothetical protein
MLGRLAAAPGRFAAALSRLDDADSVMGAGKEEWSPAEVLAHVRASHAILEPRIIQMLVRDNPPLPAFDERRWAEVARFGAVPVTASLELMALQRKELVQALKALRPEDWERTGAHEVNGQITIYDVAKYIADHDEEHCRQIEGGGG